MGTKGRTKGSWDNCSEYPTPQDFFDKLNSEFNFDLDPCATDENHKCDNYFTIADDGISKKWGGHRVFCNPPYGTETAKWVRKAYEERNNCEIIVMLLPVRTSTRYFHDYIYGKAEIRFVKGRIKFGGLKQSAPFDSMLVIYRKEA